MKIVQTPEYVDHKPLVELLENGHEGRYLDTVQRVLSICAGIRANFPGVQFLPATANPDEMIDEVHEKGLVDFVRDNSVDQVIPQEEAPDYISENDWGVSMSQGTFTAARAAASAAVTGAELVLGGEKFVYALTRPSGHHASIDKAGGYCFFNNAAIAASRLMKEGKRVFVLDIDLHHGNGTQEILYGNDFAFFYSIHAADEYPGVEYGVQYFRSRDCNIHNITLGPNEDEGHYLHFISDAIQRARGIEADVIVVSAGFDTSEHETPEVKETETFTLSRRCFYRIGRRLAHAGIPVLAVQEGGYNPDALGHDVAAFLKGLSE